MYRVSVAGASGYAGGEFLRLMAGHPLLSLAYAGANTARGAVTDFHPHVPCYADVEIGGLDPYALSNADIVVLGLPHGASAEVGAQVASRNPDATIIDLSADHRLTDREAWEAFYGGTYSEPWAYGMPELGDQRAKLAQAQYIAAPGCNASAVTLAALPAINAGLSDGTSIVATLAVGYSGAGKKAADHLLASSALGNLAPYGVGGTHRHIPEIVQNLRSVGARLDGLSFTPILAPVSRGILAVLSIPVNGISPDEVAAAYDHAWDHEPFVRAVTTPPVTGAVVGSNSVTVYGRLDRDGRTITAICALDNLVKGTAGAAMQSLNIALGMDETLGLTTVGVAP